MERNPGRLVTVFGGSGFVGRYVVRALAKRGWRIRVAVRRPDLALHLKTSGPVGTIVPVQANVRSADSVRHAVAHADAVVNLVGILAEGGRQSFAAVQAEGAKTVAEAAREAGVARFVQISALPAGDPESPSEYARTKAAGEAAALAAFPDCVIVRPGLIFGQEDGFFNRFAAMAKISPVVPLVGAETKFQPVYVGDVAAFMAAAVDGEVPGGLVYELGGADVRTFRELVEMMLEITRLKRRILLPLPFGLASLQAKVLSILPNAPLTTDQVELLKRDNVVSAEAAAEGRTLAAAGIEPRTLGAILPTYLWPYRRGGQFAEPGSAA